VIVPRIIGFVGEAGTSAEASNGRSLYNAAVLGLSKEDITVPGSLTPYDALGEVTGIEKYLDEWPNGKDDLPLILNIDNDGSCEVLSGDGTRRLAGATLTDPLPTPVP
jgi:hypothetical protein